MNIHLRFVRSVFLLGALSASFLQASVLSTAFGQAADYNVFVFSNFSDSCCNVGGNLAVGGTTTVNGFGVAVGKFPLVSFGQTNYYTYSGIATFAGSFSLNVGNGFYAPGGSTSGTNFTTTGGTGTIYLTNGSSQYITDTCSGGFNCINFVSAATSLQSYSTFLASQTSNATTTADPGGGYDIIASQPGTNYATLTAAQFAAGALHITLPAGATLVINVIPDGTGSASTSDHGLFVNGNSANGNQTTTAAENIVFNFSGTSLTTRESIIGSILAPYATVTGTNNLQINGQLIANSFTGNSGFFDFLFQGDLPLQTSAPEPATYLLLLGAALVIIGTQRLLKAHDKRTAAARAPVKKMLKRV